MSPSSEPKEVTPKELVGDVDPLGDIGKKCLRFDAVSVSVLLKLKPKCKAYCYDPTLLNGSDGLPRITFPAWFGGSQMKSSDFQIDLSVCVLVDTSRKLVD